MTIPATSAVMMVMRMLCVSMAGFGGAVGVASCLMNTYRIRYKKGMSGMSLVEADSVNGFQPTCDTYLFKREGEIVAAVPKAVVVSVERIDTGRDNEL